MTADTPLSEDGGNGGTGGKIVAMPPRLERDGLGFVWQPNQRSLKFRVDRIQNYYGGLQGEIAVTIGDRAVHTNTWVLTRQKDRTELADTLANHPSLVGWELMDRAGWYKLVEQFFTGVVMARRSGMKRFTTHAAPKLHLQHIVEKLVIKGRRPNILFSPGGSGKSIFACGMCVAMVARRGIADLSVLDGIVPMYFDYEDEADDFNDKTNMVSRGFGIDVPEIEYREMEGLLTDQIYDIAKEMSDYGANLGVIDSISAAFGSPGPGKDWNSIAQDAFNAMRLVPDVTWVLLGHVDKAHLKELAGAAFGGIQQMNRAATAWEIRTDQEPGASETHLKFHHSKWNKTAKQPVLGIKVVFDDNDAVRFESESPETIPVNAADRLVDELIGAHRLYVSEIADRLGIQQGSVRTLLSRNKDRFTRTDDGLITLNSDWSGSTAEDQDIEATPDSSDAPEKDLPW